ncbi:MAG: PKD domain-containing protein, partial [bacterium F082]
DGVSNLVVGLLSSITAVSFNYTGTSSTYDKTQSLYIGTTALSAYAGSGAAYFVPSSDMTLVYGPTLNSYQSGWRTYQFAEPFEWDGVSNLVVGLLSNSTATSSSGWGAQGTSVGAYRTIYRYRDTNPIDIDNLTAVSNGSYSMTRPDIRLSFCGYDNICPAPEVSGVEFIGDGTTAATVHWSASTGDFASSYDILVTRRHLPVDLDNVTPTYSGIEGLSQAVTGLSPYTEYDLYLRVRCNADGYDDGYSAWSAPYTFRTNSVCRTPVELQLTPVSKTEVAVSWLNGSIEDGIVTQADNFQYAWSATELIGSALIPDAEGVVGRTAGFNGLTPGSTYWFYVANNCGIDGVSPYVSAAVTMPDACATPTGLHTTEVGRYSASLAWAADPYAGPADTYELYWSAEAVDAADLDTIEPMVTGIVDAAYNLTLLQRETDYYVYLRSNCGDVNSDWALLTFTTEGLGYDCNFDEPIGTGTGTANLLNTLYGCTYSQHIYTADEIHALGGVAGIIHSVSFDYSGSSSTYAKTQSLYIGTTALSAFAGSEAANFVPSADMTLVYGPTLNSYQSGWRTYQFAEPFEWDGVSNLVVGLLSNSTSTTSSGWASRGTSVDAYRTIYRYRDSNPIDIDNLAGVPNGSYSMTRPNIRIDLCGAVLPCPSVDVPVVTAVTNESARVSWAASTGDFASSYDLIVSDTAVTDFATAGVYASEIGATVYDLSGLSELTGYYVYVRANCVNADYNDGSSVWSPAAVFSTESACFRPS